MNVLANDSRVKNASNCDKTTEKIIMHCVEKKESVLSTGAIEQRIVLIVLHSKYHF